MTRLPAVLALAACRVYGPQEAPPVTIGPTSAECGKGIAPGSDTRLVRWPYLQRVTSSSVVVAFGAEGGLASGEVSLGRDTEYTTASVPTVSEEIPYDEVDGEALLFRLHHAEITGLAPATEYCYRVTAGGAELASGLTFRTAPDDPDATIRFLAFGDYGSGTSAQLEVRDAMEPYRESADFLVTMGDNAYTSGTYSQWQERVFEPNQHLLTRVPFFPTSGNHDYYTDDGEPWLRNLFLPENADRVEDVERYYSMDWGPVHFVGLDSEDPLYRITDDVDGDDERDWLRSDLERADRPWTIAAVHKPMRSNMIGRGADGMVLAYLVPTLEEFDVPLVLQGHNHNYERFAPMKNGQPFDAKVGGTTYVISGGGGASLYELEVGKDELQVLGAKTYHFLKGTVDRCTLTVDAVDEDGFVFDTFTLERC
jgi:hypothetical protein